MLSLGSFCVELMVALFWETSRTSRVLISIYLLLLIQTILVLSSPAQPQLNAQNTIDEKRELAYQAISKTYLEETPTKNNLIWGELDAKDSASTPLSSKPSTRDSLINQGLIYLYQDNQEMFLEYIHRAKQLDPNWEGWL